ncbi:hypothetical protein HZH68_003597 [Vespula germanica]|uniref:Uncharacterized protein n=1 Tax=Vespula germanica TaxID=30212 RepID=A0A834U3J3_VESGE|nr:hypothetical protein HZH68_003597 [Vespula germanica]
MILGEARCAQACLPWRLFTLPVDRTCSDSSANVRSWKATSRCASLAKRNTLSTLSAAQLTRWISTASNSPREQSGVGGKDGGGGGGGGCGSGNGSGAVQSFLPLPPSGSTNTQAHDTCVSLFVMSLRLTTAAEDRVHRSAAERKKKIKDSAVRSQERWIWKWNKDFLSRESADEKRATFDSTRLDSRGVSSVTSFDLTNEDYESKYQQ